MVKDIISSLLNDSYKGIDARQNLSRIRELIKIDENKEALLLVIYGEEENLLKLFESDDAKTRKNAALLIADIGTDVTAGIGEQSNNVRKTLMEALKTQYEKEEQQFVKEFYLKAIQSFDYREYVPWLKNELKAYENTKADDSNAKHINACIKQLTGMILGIEGLKKHVFTGGNVLSDVFLLANRKNLDCLSRAVIDDAVIDAKDITVMSAGVRVNTNKVEYLIPIRIYNEMLFAMDKLKVCSSNYAEAAEQIVRSGLYDFLEKRHFPNKKPYYFRIELKSSHMELDEKAAFTKKLATSIEQLSGRRLINNTSNYEFEIRLIENKNKKFNCLIKFYTIIDDRFSYRTEVVAASIKPVNAALLVSLAKEYMIKDAQVLDPFCGVGTMLIERHKQVAANTSYGIDIYGEAIEKAKINTENAHQIIHYINKDFFDFEHEYKFDEIFTNMPFKSASKPESEIEEIYRRFFDKAGELLSSTGLIIMYTHNRDFVEKYSKLSRFKIIKKYIINEKEGTDLYIIR